MTPHVVHLRGWPGLEDWLPPGRPAPYAERLGDQIGLVVHAAAWAGTRPERFGLGAALIVLGHSVYGGVLIVPDDLEVADPAAFDGIQQWAQRQPVDTVLGPRPWSVVTLSAFFDPYAKVEEAPWAFAPRAYSGAGPCVGAGLGRFFGLVAEHIVERRGLNVGSWEIWLPGWGVLGAKSNVRRRSPHRPGIRLKSRRVGWQVEFGPCSGAFGKKVDGRAWRGTFVDVLSLAYALDADRGASFAEHCQNVGVAAEELPVSVTVDSTGADQLATAVRTIHALAGRLDEEAGCWFTTSRDRTDRRNRVDLARTSSAGALAGQVLSRFGARAPIETFGLNETEHRQWAETFHGGWCEASTNLLGTKFPAVSADVSSCFPLVAHLLGWWELITAERIERRDVSSDLRQLCQRAVVDPSVLLDPSVWALFGCTLVEVHPAGERWPVEIEDERRPDGRLEITGLSSPERSMFYPWLDVVGAAVASKRVPLFDAATKYVGVGRQSVQRHLPLLPGVVLHADEDPVLTLVRARRRAKAAGDQRQAAVLRLVVNSLVFGVLSRFDEIRRRDAKGWVVGERPGPWSCLSIASSVAAGSRLLLMILDRMVSDPGGLVAYRDTDSSLIPASLHGGSLQLRDGTTRGAMSYDDLAQIFAAFEPLAPATWWPVWKVERGEGDALDSVVFGPKRHAELICGQLVSWTEANLGGAYVDPPEMAGRMQSGSRRWSLAAVGREVHAARQGTRGRAPWDPGDALPFPAIRRLVVKSPEMARQLPKAFGARPGTRYLEMTAGTIAPRAVVALDPGGDLSDWDSLNWFDKGTGEPVHVTTDPGNTTAALIETLDDRAARWSDEPKTRRFDMVIVDPRSIQHVGRVSGVIDADMDGCEELIGYRPFYGDSDHLAALQSEARAMGKRRFARRTGLPLKVAERAALGGPISAMNIARAWRALQTGDPTVRPCSDDQCSQWVVREGALYCSARCRDRVKKRRKRGSDDG